MRELFFIRVCSRSVGVAGSRLAAPLVFGSKEAALDYVDSHWFSLSAIFPGLQRDDFSVDSLFEVPYNV